MQRLNNKLILSALCCAVTNMFESPAVSAATTYSVIVDDYAAPFVTVSSQPWEYSRIGTNRGKMGNQVNNVDTYAISIANHAATATVTSGWGGMWTSLLHLAIDNDLLDPLNLFGPYIKPTYQARLTGIQIDILDGSGTFKIELRDKQNAIYTESFTLSGGKQKLSFDYAPTVPLKFLNWWIDGVGNATVDEVRLLVSAPDLTPEQKIFLFSYGHLSQSYNQDTGLVRDMSHYPGNESLALQSTGMFALATAAAYQLGYVEKSDAEAIVKKTAAALKSLPNCHGLLPHLINGNGINGNNSIAPNAEWSSIDTVISLTANLLAAQYLHLDVEIASLQDMIKAIDWADLTYGYTSATSGVSMGYDHDCSQKLPWNWGTFGSEMFLIGAAFSAAEPDKNVIGIKDHEYPPTWDGSGFNDELAALFFPMRGADYWNNNWDSYRASAFNTQLAHFAGKTEYVSRGLFGLSACEVPERWEVAGNIYWPWGVGGYNGIGAVDGSVPIPGCSGAACSPVVGYPIVAPHYAAMICKEHPSSCKDMFNYLISQYTFSPLNNTESVGIKDGELKWSSSKGSWNLSMQALGAARALSANNFVPYQALCSNKFLLNSYNKLMPKQGGAPCSVSIPFIYQLLLKR